MHLFLSKDALKFLPVELVECLITRDQLSGVEPLVPELVCLLLS
jgi:hypothetical protein